MAFINGDMKIALNRTSSALAMASDLGKADGIAEALHLLGLIFQNEGKRGQALAEFLAATAIYPVEQNPIFRASWQAIDQIRHDSGGDLRTILISIKEKAFMLRGPFSHLTALSVNRVNNMHEMLNRVN